MALARVSFLLARYEDAARMTTTVVDTVPLNPTTDGDLADAIAILAPCLDPRIAGKMSTRIELLPTLARLAIMSGDRARDLPEPLRSALVGRRARRRPDHLLIIAGHTSVRQAAQALGRWPGALYDQLSRTERACGGPRSTAAPGHRAPGS